MADNPTPAQARALKELLDHGNAVFITARGARWRRREAHRRSGRISKPTAKALVRRGWLQLDDPGLKLYSLSDEGAEVAASLTHADTAQEPKVGPTTSDLLKAIRRYYKESEGWLMATEVAAPQGERYIDAMVLRGSDAPISFELKIDRQDWLNELANPMKRQWMVALSSQVWACAPSGLIQKAEVPPEMGLLEWLPDQSLVATIPAPIRYGMKPDWRIVAAFSRALMR